MTELTVATILLTAAAESSSPLGWSTRVMPRCRMLKVIPSRRVSLVSVQFSASSGARGEKANRVKRLWGNTNHCNNKYGLNQVSTDKLQTASKCTPTTCAVEIINSYEEINTINKNTAWYSRPKTFCWMPLYILTSKADSKQHWSSSNKLKASFFNQCFWYNFFFFSISILKCIFSAYLH